MISAPLPPFDLEVVGQLRVLPAQRLGHRGPAVVGAGVRLGAVREEEVDEIAPAEERRLLERREALRLPDVRIGPALEEELRRLELTRKERRLERRVPELRPRAEVRIRAVVEEEPRGLGRSRERGEVQSRPAEGVPGRRETRILLEPSRDLGGVADPQASKKVRTGFFERSAWRALFREGATNASPSIRKSSVSIAEASSKRIFGFAFRRLLFPSSDTGVFATRTTSSAGRPSR